MEVNEILVEIIKAMIWAMIGSFPIMVGVAVHMWADIRSLKKAMNAAFKKIRSLEGDKEICGRDE